MIKILIIDDHPLVREGLKQILSDSEDIVVSGESGYGKETINMIALIQFQLKTGRCPACGRKWNSFWFY